MASTYYKGYDIQRGYFDSTYRVEELDTRTHLAKFDTLDEAKKAIDEHLFRKYKYYEIRNFKAILLYKDPRFGDKYTVCDPNIYGSGVIEHYDTLAEAQNAVDSYHKLICETYNIHCDFTSEVYVNE